MPKFSIERTGALTEVPGSPFTFDLGTVDSRVVLWSPFGQILFASNQGSGSVIDFIVGPKGKLTVGANQPVNLGDDAQPVGMALNTMLTPARTTVSLLYVASSQPNQVFVFTVDPDGTLTAFPISPFPTVCLLELSSLSPSTRRAPVNEWG